MASPSSATHRYSKEYCQIGPTLRAYAEDDNADETASDLFPPYARFGPPLMFFFKNEARTVDAGDSFQQGGGSVGSYSWNGGGSGSSKSYSFASNGSTEITCTVTGGGTTVGRRQVSVCERPGTGAASDQAITSFRRGPIRGVVSERGWTGYSVDVEITDASLFSAFAKNQLFVIYREEYERTGSGAYSLFASGEIFSGIITVPRRVLRGDGDKLSFTAMTLDGLFSTAVGTSIDGDDHAFVDAIYYESNEVSDPLGGGGLSAPVTGSTPALNAVNIPVAHRLTTLTLGKVLSHLLNYHTLVDVGGTRRRLPEIADVISDWWNLSAGSTATQQTRLNIPRGPLKGSIESCLPEGVWVMYSDRLSGINLSPHHAMKSTPDADVDSIDPDLIYELEPIEGDTDAVRQSRVVQSPQAMTDQTATALIGTYPTSPDASGSLDQPSQPFWFTTQADGDALAEARYHMLNANARVRVRLAGAPFGLFNRFTYSGDSYWVESDSIDRPNADSNGGLHQEVVGRLVP
jgi:hypothetical protein